MDGESKLVLVEILNMLKLGERNTQIFREHAQKEDMSRHEKWLQSDNEVRSIRAKVERETEESKKYRELALEMQKKEITLLEEIKEILSRMEGI